MSFQSDIEGTNSAVAVYSDRIEWVRKSGGVSAGKITAGIFTAGLSLAATGVGRGSYGAGKTSNVSILHLGTVTGIASVKDGKRVVVTVSTPSMALPLNLPKKEAEQMARTLNNLVTAARAHAVTPSVNIQIARQSLAPAAETHRPAGQDPTAQLQALADLHRQGILSDDEFGAAKAKALGI